MTFLTALRRLPADVKTIVVLAACTLAFVAGAGATAFGAAVFGAVALGVLVVAAFAAVEARMLQFRYANTSA